MKNLFKSLSGRPKDGKIQESIKPAIAIPQGFLSLLLMLIAINTNSILAGIMSLLFAWQIGWGMSIERFKKFDN